MKLAQLHHYVIKQLLKKEKYVYDEDDYNVYFSEGYTIYIVSKEDNFINLDKVRKMNLLRTFKPFNFKKAIPVENMTILSNNDYKKEVVKATCNNKILYFAKDRLKYFDKNYKLYKMDSNPFKPIYLTENGILKGILWPLRLKDDMY